MPRKSKAQVEIEKRIEDLDRQIAEKQAEIERATAACDTLMWVVKAYEDILERIQGDKKDGTGKEGSTD
jgi:uncharacterized coiled-coil protein SlyX